MQPLIVTCHLSFGAGVPSSLSLLFTLLTAHIEHSSSKQFAVGEKIDLVVCQMKGPYVASTGIFMPPPPQTSALSIH